MKPEIPYCKGKVRYDKKGAITAKNRRYAEDHVELREYACPKCGGWHLTSQMVKRNKNEQIHFHNKRKPRK